MFYFLTLRLIFPKSWPLVFAIFFNTQFNQVFLTSAAIIFVQSTGRVGACSEDPEERGPGRCTSIRIRSVINFDRPWTPPPPNAGAMPRLGVFHHWRVD